MLRWAVGDIVHLFMTDSDRETLLQHGVASSTMAGRTILRNLVIEVVAGPSAGRRVRLGSKPLVVGGERACDLVLDDPAVSRHHAELQVTSHGIRVRDLDSTNGTFVRDTRITEAVVQVGAALRFGSTSVRVCGHAPPTVPPSERRRFGELLGESLAMREVFAILELVAPSDSTVVIQGESGTGKELAAIGLHDHSRRAGGPLVIVDCGATNEQLIDSQLFGHVRGAFTGAVSDRKGAIAAADGGTLLLDEIGELPLGSQAKLLRALEARTIQPVGSDKRIKVNTRVIAATHRDLAAMVEAREFRFDLFHRLAVVHLSMPPLRDRPEDIPDFVRAFYKSRERETGELQCDNLRRLQAFEWPGNVRELRNVLERAWVMAGPEGKPFPDLPLWLPGEGQSPAPAKADDVSMPFKEAKDRAIDSFERTYLAELFAKHDGNISQAARSAGLTRRHMRELLRKHGLVKS